MIIIVLTLIGLMANWMQISTDSTSKFSFKGAGTVHRRRYIMKREIDSFDSQIKIVKKSSNLSSTNETISSGKAQQPLNQTVSNKTFVYESIEKNLADTKKSHSFRVLSSFECDGSIPSALTNYVSNTFVTEYKRSYGDVILGNTFLHVSNMTFFTRFMPNLTDVRISCDLDKPCQTLFIYDKKRGLDKAYSKENIFSGSDKVYPRDDVFFCCPPMDDETFTDECNHAKGVIQKSTFRESKKPFFLERVNFLKYILNFL